MRERLVPDPFPGFWYGVERGRLTLHVVASMILDSLPGDPAYDGSRAFCGKALDTVYRRWPRYGRLCSACRNAVAERMGSNA
jgi:hypothetical protein